MVEAAPCKPISFFRTLPSAEQIISRYWALADLLICLSYNLDLRPAFYRSFT